MSRATLKVEFPGNHTLYGIYCGTSDCAYADLYDTETEAWDNYRKMKNEGTLFNRPRPEPALLEDVKIFTDYGTSDDDRWGVGWDGRACRTTKYIYQGCLKYPDDYL